MAGGAPASPAKREALAAFERSDDSAPELIANALKDAPGDGGLLIADAAAQLRCGGNQPFARIEGVLGRTPDWIEGHKALARLKAEALDPEPLATLEGALKKLPQNPRLWMAYLTLLGGGGPPR